MSDHLPLWAVFRFPDASSPSADAPIPLPPGERHDDMEDARNLMVRVHLQGRDIADERVLDAMRKTPRERFIPQDLRNLAYADRPLPIGQGQTISQPYIVAFMTQLLQLQGHERVLEIGTGSGYQAAVLAKLAHKVYSMEIRCDLLESAKSVFSQLGIENVQTRCADGYQGWPEEAPFDAVLLTAAPPEIPPKLLEQVAPGGKLVAPVGEHDQWLVRMTRTPDGSWNTERFHPVRFVPMVPAP